MMEAFSLNCFTFRVRYYIRHYGDVFEKREKKKIIITNTVSKLFVLRVCNVFSRSRSRSAIILQVATMKRVRGKDERESAMFPACARRIRIRLQINY
jgi:hypothetical protein